MTGNRRRRLGGGLIVLVFAMALALLVWAGRPSSVLPQRGSPSSGTTTNASVTTSEDADAQSVVPTGGSGPAEVRRVQESVEYIIRDGKGRVKDAKKSGQP